MEELIEYQTDHAYLPIEDFAVFEKDGDDFLQIHQIPIGARAVCCFPDTWVTARLDPLLGVIRRNEHTGELTSQVEWAPCIVDKVRPEDDCIETSLRAGGTRIVLGLENFVGLGHPPDLRRCAISTA